MNPEFEQFIAKTESETKESEGESEERGFEGFSEEQLDKDSESGVGEWQNLRTLHGFKTKPRLERIALLYASLASSLKKLVEIYAAQNNEKQKEETAEEIQRLRILQDVTLNCLFWSRGARSSASVQAGSGSAGELTDEELKNMVPHEIWEIIA